MRIERLLFEKRSDGPRWARWVAVCVALATLTSGCSHHRAHISYDEYDEVRLQPESFDPSTAQVERLGEVFVREGGAIWRECTDVARGALWLLVDEAKRRGGNAVGDIRWMPRSDPWFGERPTCKRRWGFFLVWPVLATPAFMAANVEGVIYRIEDHHAPAAGVYRLPDSEAETHAWVESVLAATRPATAEES